MAKLHELLAAEKTPTGAWNQLYEDTLKKFKNVSHFFDGHSKSLAMIEEGPQSKAIEDQAREEKPVTTTVYDTLEYALDIFGKAEDLQYQKNETNRKATGTVLWRGILLHVADDFIEGTQFGEFLSLEFRQRWELIAHRTEDFHALDGVDAEISLDVHFEFEHLGRITCFLRDDVEQGC
jgi:hypothetical protein